MNNLIDLVICMWFPLVGIIIGGLVYLIVELIERSDLYEFILWLRES